MIVESGLPLEDQEPSVNLGRVTARLARFVEVALAEVELTLPQYRILVFLDEGGGAASSLAERLALSRPTITAVVDGLVARGLVERVPHPDDRRRVDHVMTDAGRAALAGADAAAECKLGHIAEYGRKTKANSLIAGLQRWREALDQHLIAAIAEHVKDENVKTSPDRTPEAAKA